MGRRWRRERAVPQAAVAERLRARRGKPLLERPAPDSRHRRRGLAGERHVRRLRRPGPARRRHERVVAALGGLRGADQPAGATARPRQAAVPEYGPLPPGGEQAAEPVPRRHAGRKPLLPVHSGLGLRDRPRLAGRIQAGTGDRPRDRPLDPLNRTAALVRSWLTDTTTDTRAPGAERWLPPSSSCWACSSRKWS